MDVIDVCVTARIRPPIPPPVAPDTTVVNDALNAQVSRLGHQPISHPLRFRIANSGHQVQSTAFGMLRDGTRTSDTTAILDSTYTRKNKEKKKKKREQLPLAIQN
jgi:hypothetical protein